MNVRHIIVEKIYIIILQNCVNRLFINIVLIINNMMLLIFFIDKKDLLCYLFGLIFKFS